MTEIIDLISKELNLSKKAVENTISLLDEGCTIPFISRYRKEKTGALDEVKIGEITQQYDRLKELVKRKDTIVKTISDLGKLTDELEKRIRNCWNATELEDIYLPYKPKRRTRAQWRASKDLNLLPQSSFFSVSKILRKWQRNT